MNKTIILSVDGNPTYAWFVPLCSLMWRDVAGFDVSCIYVGPIDPWFTKCAAQTNTLVYEAPNVSCSIQAASQLIRLFSYLLPDMGPDSYLLSVDADAWPLSSVFDPSGAPIDLLYPTACDRAETPYFPIGYIGATTRSWREFVGIDGSSPEEGLAKFFATDPTILNGHTGWNYDETFITRKIKAWPGFRNANVRKREGDPPVDRVDRANWPASPTRQGKIDAHLIRPGWTDKNWPRLRPLLAECLTSDHLAWTDRYREETCERFGSQGDAT